MFCKIHSVFFFIIRCQNVFDNCVGSSTCTVEIQIYIWLRQLWIWKGLLFAEHWVIQTSIPFWIIWKWNTLQNLAVTFCSCQYQGLLRASRPTHYVCAHVEMLITIGGNHIKLIEQCTMWPWWIDQIQLNPSQVSSISRPWS